MADVTIVQEDKTRAVIDDEVTLKFAAARALVITPPTAAGAAYDQVEATTVVTSIDEIIAVLRAAGLTV